MSIGQKIISEIIKQGMIRADGHESVVFIWNANAEDQLSALVAQCEPPSDTGRSPAQWIANAARDMDSCVETKGPAYYGFDEIKAEAIIQKHYAAYEAHKAAGRATK